jgi:hypothetical protein
MAAKDNSIAGTQEHALRHRSRRSTAKDFMAVEPMASGRKRPAPAEGHSAELTEHITIIYHLSSFFATCLSCSTKSM